MLPTDGCHGLIPACRDKPCSGVDRATACRFAAKQWHPTAIGMRLRLGEMVRRARTLPVADGCFTPHPASPLKGRGVAITVALVMLLAAAVASGQPSTQQIDAEIDAATAAVQAGRERFADPSLDSAQRVAALESAEAQLRALVDRFPQHWQWPVWQVDLAETLLFDDLGGLHQHADLFCRFGLATPEQRKVFAAKSDEAMSRLEEARLAFYRLQHSLPQREEHRTQRLAADRWRQWLTHRDLHLPVLHAQAAINVATANNDPQLLKSALADLHPLIYGHGDDDIRGRDMDDRLWAMAAEAYIGLGRFDEADDALDRVRQPKGNLGLLVTLLQARLLERQGQVDEALTVLADARTQTQMQAVPLDRLLLADAIHLLLHPAAENVDARDRQAAMRAAFAGYEPLLADPLAGEQLRPILYERWRKKYADEQSFADLPATVLAGIGESALNAARNAEAPADATHLLQQSAAASHAALGRDSLSRSRQAQVMMNLAWAIYDLDPADWHSQLNAAKLWTHLADELTDQSEAEAAIAHAATVLRHLREAGIDPAREQIEQAYLEAAELLFAKFPVSAVADDERLYYGYYILQAQQRYGEAAAVYERIPFGHDDYFEARRERLYCFLAQHAAAEGQTRRTLADQLGEQAAELERQATEYLTNSPRNTSEGIVAAAHNALGHARLVRAQLAISEGRVAEARDLLADFDTLAAGDSELQRLGAEKRLTVFVSLRELDAAAAAAQQLMDAFADRGAAIIAGLFDQIQDQVAAARRAADHSGASAAEKLADVAEQLARRLLEQTRSSPAASPQRISDMTLLHARALLLVNRPAEAMPVLRSLGESRSDDADVLYTMAEAAFAIGGHDHLAEAQRCYYRLIQGLPAHSDRWWHAWMRSLQIRDGLSGDTADSEIYLAVRQLELEDARLGGEPYRSALIKLRDKHQP